MPAVNGGSSRRQRRHRRINLGISGADNNLGEVSMKRMTLAARRVVM